MMLTMMIFIIKIINMFVFISIIVVVIVVLLLGLVVVVITEMVVNVNSDYHCGSIGHNNVSTI